MRYARTTAPLAARPSELYQRTFSAAAARSAPGRSLRTLIVTSSYLLAYRVIRAATDLGAIAYVFGPQQATGLARSHFCKGFFLSDVPIDGSSDARLAEAVNQVARLYDIDLIIGADAEATRSLISLRRLLEAPCFPMPSLEAFDRLNDKWRFKQLCDALAIPHPRTLLCDGSRDLASVVRNGGFAYPIVVKPTDQSGSRGVVKITSEESAAKFGRPSYPAFLVQEFVDGEEIGACAFCEGGRVKVFFAHSYHKGIYKTFQDEQIQQYVDKIAFALTLQGIFNFDLVRRSDDSPVFLECNPRAYYKLMMSVFAGANLLAYAAPWAGRQARQNPITPTEVVMPKGLLRAPWKLNATAARALGALLDDPVPFFCEKLGLAR